MRNFKVISYLKHNWRDVLFLVVMFALIYWCLAHQRPFGDDGVSTFLDGSDGYNR